MKYAPFGFSKKYRLLKRTEFLRLSRFGKKIQNRHFIVLYHRSQSGNTRLGITVTKKVGNAVTRNRIKRISREFFRQNRHNLTGCWDINIIAKKPASELNSAQTWAGLEGLFDRIVDNENH